MKAFAAVPGKRGDEQALAALGARGAIRVFVEVAPA